MKICGIDPGANGAMCVLDTDIPTYTALLDFKKHSIYEACSWLNSFTDLDSIWIEDVHSLFGMSAKSNFGFGRNLGIARAIAEIASAGDNLLSVTPKVWQKFVGVTVKGKEIKKQVANIAQELYPMAILHGKLGGLLDGRSDAMCIAHFGINNTLQVTGEPIND